MGRHDQLSADGEGAAGRLRDRIDRHRPQRWQRVVRHRSSGKVDRLRLSRRPRDDRAVEGAHQRALSEARAAVVLERLLDGWTAGPDGRAAVSGRFRRDSRGCAGEQSQPHGYLTPGGVGANGEGPGQCSARRQARDGDAGGARRMRWPRRREGRLPRRSARVHVRCREAPMSGRRRGVVPHRRASDDDEARLCAVEARERPDGVRGEGARQRDRVGHGWAARPMLCR